MNHTSLRSRMLLGLLFGVGFAQAAGGPLPLKAGTYVLASDAPCKDAALAAVIDYDATQGLFGPHESDCRTTILSHKGNAFHVRRTCRANGDGSPAAPASFDMRLRIKSATAFVTLPDKGREALEYDLCPGFH